MHYLITGKGPDNQITYEGGWQNNRPAGMHQQFRMVENILEEPLIFYACLAGSRCRQLYFPSSDYTSMLIQFPGF